MIVFIADAPCHGKKYHKNLADNFPDGDPMGRSLEEYVKDFANMRIHFLNIQITNDTEKMIEIIRNVYKNTSG